MAGFSARQEQNQCTSAARKPRGLVQTGVPVAQHPQLSTYFLRQVSVLGVAASKQLSRTAVVCQFSQVPPSFWLPLQGFAGKRRTGLGLGKLKPAQARVTLDKLRKVLRSQMAIAAHYKITTIGSGGKPAAKCWLQLAANNSARQLLLCRLQFGFR